MASAWLRPVVSVRSRRTAVTGGPHLPDAMEPGFHRARTHWNRGLIAFQLVRRIQAALLMVPTWPESGFQAASAPYRPVLTVPAGLKSALNITRNAITPPIVLAPRQHSPYTRRIWQFASRTACGPLSHQRM